MVRRDGESFSCLVPPSKSERDGEPRFEVDKVYNAIVEDVKNKENLSVEMGGYLIEDQSNGTFSSDIICYFLFDISSHLNFYLLFITVFESTAEFQETLELYRKRQARVTLKADAPLVDFASGTDKMLRNFPTDGNLQLLSLFMSQGDQSEQVYGINVNHRDINFSMAEDKVTKAVFREEFQGSNTDAAVDGSNTNTAPDSDRKVSKFGAGGNIIAAYPFEEVSTAQLTGMTKGSYLDLVTNYHVDSKSTDKRMKLNNRFARYLTPKGFEDWLSVFRIARAKKNQSKAVKMCELAEAFKILRDFDLSNEDGIRKLCDVTGLQLDDAEDLSKTNLPHVKNKIGKILRRLGPARFSMLEGNHRMTIVAMICKGVLAPSSAHKHQEIIKKDHPKWKDVPEKSPMNSTTRFDVYFFDEGKNIEFELQVDKLRDESHFKALHQQASMQTHIKEEFVSLIRDMIENGLFKDVDRRYWKEAKDTEYPYNRTQLKNLLVETFKDEGEPKYPKLHQLLCAKKKKGVTIKAIITEITNLFNNSNKTYGCVTTRGALQQFDNGFISIIQLMLNTLIRKSDMIELRRFLTMDTTPDCTQRKHGRNPTEPLSILGANTDLASNEGLTILSKSDRTRYRDPDFMLHTFSSAPTKLWENLQPLVSQAYFNFKVVNWDNKKKGDKEGKDYVKRHTGRHECALRCAYQTSLLKAFNRHGEDFEVKDKVAEFALK